MPSYGTKIADFKGVLHDVSKSAFDALAMQNVDSDLKTATDPFRETINKYLAKVGLEVDWTEPGAVEKLLKNTAAKVAAAYAGKVVASASCDRGRRNRRGRSRRTHRGTDRDRHGSRHRGV